MFRETSDQDGLSQGIPLLLCHPKDHQHSVIVHVYYWWVDAGPLWVPFFRYTTTWERTGRLPQSGPAGGSET